ncbi:MAG TPA: Ldh family oxidoreductase, partial [Sphaerochaeta sp.]|nr:Ldh family oxidoreductase [Sphaerochaeta sp.]
ELNETPVAEGQDRVLWAGQKEQEAEARANLEGVPLSMNVVSQLRTIGKDLGIAFPRLLSK